MEATRHAAARTRAAKPKAVFFDAAGTLFEARQPVGRSYSLLAQEFGLNADENAVSAAFRRAFHAAPGLAFGPGHSGAELRRLERQWWRERVAETFAGLGRFGDYDSYFDALFRFFADPGNWRADPQAPALLARLKQAGCILGVVSNFDARLYRILEGLGLAQFFDSTTISSEAGYAKPSPELFKVALAKHSLHPGEAIHVGDSIALDVGGATAAGVAAVLIEREEVHHSEGLAAAARVRSLEAVFETVIRGEPA